MDGGAHAARTPADSIAAHSRHARLFLTPARDSSEYVRRDGSSAASKRSKRAVAERGGLHGAPEPEPDVEPRIAAHTSARSAIVAKPRR